MISHRARLIISRQEVVIAEKDACSMTHGMLRGFPHEKSRPRLDLTISMLESDG